MSMTWKNKTMIYLMFRLKFRMTYRSQTRQNSYESRQKARENGKERQISERSLSTFKKKQLDAFKEQTANSEAAMQQLFEKQLKHEEREREKDIQLLLQLGLDNYLQY